jgi:hypothetical protein
MLREDRRLFLWMTLAGLALRLFFFVYFPSVTDDSRVYFDFAGNWLQHGVYGQTQLGEIVPADTRLPGYPAFLAVVFWVFGVGNVRAVLLTQILFDLATCALIADLARRMGLGRVAIRVAFGMAALCPFLAIYSTAALTETLEVFFTTLALDCAAVGLKCIDDGELDWKAAGFWAASGAAIGACILLRPDGGILLAAVGLYVAVATVRSAFVFRASGAVQAPLLKLLTAGIVLAVCALAPLVPWTARNFRTLHHFQPLAPRYANESDEQAPRGFNRWVTTWMAEFVSVEEIYWYVPGDKIDASKLPARALDKPTREATLAVIADYNQSSDLTLELDARFGALAAERYRAHPWRCHLVLPVLRAADMWLRPRTEFLPPDIRWWEFNDDPQWSALAVGYGLLNLACVGAALFAGFWRRSSIRYAGMLILFLALRTAFLITVENPEPRYTLECYPAVIVLAALAVGGSRRQTARTP